MTVAAGEFGAWLRQMQAVLRGEGGIDVPCGSCRGCCVSGYPVVLRDADAAVTAQVPAQHIALSHGLRYMTARPDGTCPMLQDGDCSVYALRPQTCRDYDCRVFAAAGLLPGGPQRWVINQRVAQWSFDYADDRQRHVHQAVRDAAAFIQRVAGTALAPQWSAAPTAVAVLALKAWPAFLKADPMARDDTQVATAVAAAVRRFDQGDGP